MELLKSNTFMQEYHDYSSKKYIAFLLDKSNTVTETSIDGVELITSNNEYNLLSKFLNKWNDCISRKSLYIIQSLLEQR